MLTPWYPDEANPNAGLFIRDQAKALSNHHEVLVITAKVNYDKASLFSYTVKRSATAGVVEFRISIDRSLPLYNQLNQLFITCWQSWLIAKRFNPDIIHASIGYPGAFWAWMLSKLLKRPYVFTEHTRVTNNFRSAFHKQLTLFGLKRASALMAVGSTLAKEITTITQLPVTVIPNMVDVAKFSSAQRSSIKVPQFGFLGGMNTPVKGLDILLKAVAQIDINFVLHIGGRGALLDEYKAMANALSISNKCRFYGFVDPAKLPDFMSQLHFFVCASRYETFCISLVEAMASGLPVVSTRCGGPEDFVNATNGMLCEKEDPDALRKTIEDMILQYNNYSQSDLKNFSLRYSPTNVVEQLTQIYHGVLRG